MKNWCLLLQVLGLVGVCMSQSCTSANATALDDNTDSNLAGASLLAGSGTRKLRIRSFLAKRANLDCSSAETCVSYEGTLLCLNFDTLDFKADDGTTGNLDTGAYTLSNGQAGNLLTGPTPAATGAGVSGTKSNSIASASVTGGSAASASVSNAAASASASAGTAASTASGATALSQTINSSTPTATSVLASATSAASRATSAVSSLISSASSAISATSARAQSQATSASTSPSASPSNGALAARYVKPYNAIIAALGLVALI